MDDMEPFMNNDIFNVRDISEIEGKWFQFRRIASTLCSDSQKSQ